MSFADARALFYAALAVSLPTFAWVVLGVLLKWLGLLPHTLNEKLAHFAFMFGLPLVLVCIGASMNFSRFYKASTLTWESTLWRLCIAPLLGILLAWMIGVRDEHLGVMFLLLASPVAASSHVMVVAARGDGTLAANIVVLTTLLSIFTITCGFFVLSLLSLAGNLH